MDVKTQAKFEARAKIMKALGHPTRLFMVDELSHGEKCVCELTDMVGADISTVSKHLTVLKEAGIVQDEKRGLQVFYTLRLPCVKGFFQCMDTMIKTKVKQQMELVK